MWEFIVTWFINNFQIIGIVIYFFFNVLSIVHMGKKIHLPGKVLFFLFGSIIIIFFGAVSIFTINRGEPPYWNSYN